MGANRPLTSIEIVWPQRKLEYRKKKPSPLTREGPFASQQSLNPRVSVMIKR